MKLLPRFFVLLCAPLCALAQTPDLPQFKAEHVVMIVWDGMRPDFVTPDHAPTLSQLVSHGVFFAHNHSVFPTSTEVNGTALATGMYPNHSGVMANKEYRPDIEPLRAIDIQSLAAARKGDAVSGGKYLLAPTVAEILHTQGVRTVVAGTKPVAMLHDRAAREDGGLNGSVNLFEGKTLPVSALATITEKVGALPEKITFPNVEQDKWTARALTESLWKDGVPKFSVLWMSDPDFTQHKFGPGSPEALKAIGSVDANLGVVLHALEEKGVREKTDVFIVSDHGFSNVGEQPDVAAALVKGGVDAVRGFAAAPKDGQVFVVGNGGVVLFYVIGHDGKVAEQVVEILQSSAFSGVIATRANMEGTFTLDQLRINTAGAPDVVLAMRWSDDKVGTTPGVLLADGAKKTINGGHASMSRFEIHNTLIAAGPDFREGFVDEMPSANVDVAPTILAILGVKQPLPMDGRVLREALRDAKPVDEKPVKTRNEIFHTLQGRTWHQYFLQTKFDGEMYLDEGNGSAK